ncbi:phosphate ABC transporter permease PtsA, partial [Mycobacterium tuberculosis]
MSTAQNLLVAKALAETRQAKFAARNRVNKIALTLSLAAMAFGVFWLIWILWETLRQGVG